MASKGYVVRKSSMSARNIKKLADMLGDGKKKTSSTGKMNAKVFVAIDAKDWIDSGAWVNVKSSNVSAIAYNVDKKQLFVEFGARGRKKSYYMYPGVDRSNARAFFNSPSFGKAIWKMFRYPRRPYNGPLGNVRNSQSVRVQ